MEIDEEKDAGIITELHWESRKRMWTMKTICDKNWKK